MVSKFLEDLKAVIEGLKTVGKMAEEMRAIKESMQKYQGILENIEKRLDSILTRFPFR